MMQEDAINVYCLSHGFSFPVSGSNRVVICKENHVLSYNFPHSGRWFFCCLCQKYWVAPKGEDWQDDFSKQCPSCNLIKKARYYSCDQCNVTMIDSLGAINRKGAHVTPWGTPHPHCPGCHQLPKSVPQSHACPELNGLLTTARAECPFCEGKEMAQGVVDGGELRGESEAPRVGIADEFADPSSIALEELERRASEIRTLEAEAEARETKAQERLRQVEARLRQEMLRRSEVERKSHEIEDELKRQQEIEQGRVEASRAASEAAARFEEEKKARIVVEQSKAEAEAKLREMEVRASDVEGRLRQTEAGLQQEASKRSLAEEKANELEIRLAAETAKVRAEAEEKIQGIGAEARRIEGNYKAEIDWIRAELERVMASMKQAEANHRAEVESMIASTKQAEENHRAEMKSMIASTKQAEANHRAELESMIASTKQAEENHRAEIARITAEAEARSQRVEANTRQQYQIKVEEAIANAQAAMFNLDETQKKLDETEARRYEMEIKARQAVNLCRRLYLISKLSFTSAEQVIAETLDAGDENEKDALVIPLDLATNPYPDDFSSETPASGSNGSLDYEDYQFSDRMRALFEAAARVNAPDDKSGRVGSGE
jgi:hypothetical protein